MAGNVGTQSLAVTIRVLMDENLDGKQKLGLVFKEARVGDVQRSDPWCFFPLYLSDFM